LRKEGKLKSAAEALISCSQPVCPAFIAKECTNLYTETQASLPSVTVRATDGEGQILTSVDVYLDGELVTKTLDGRALTLDPGVHEFRFETEGKPSLTSKVLVAEGEKNKVVAADFPAPQKADVAKPGTAPLDTAPPAPREKAGPPIAAYVVGGIGVAAVGAGVVLRLIADKDYDDYEKSCSPNCSQSKVDSLDLKYNLSYVALGVGGAALVTSGVLFLVHGSANKAEPATGFAVAPVTNGMFASWNGSF
jgi:prolyl-tRNA editing enzyme YbaK/EbsC (Cys-tRNA(Pro) deacylase)